MQIPVPCGMQAAMRPKGTAVELERRRRRAMRLLESGPSLATVARMVGAAFSAVWRWREAVRRHGPAALVPKPVPARPPKLTVRQRERLPRLPARGGGAHGYSTDLWTAKRGATENHGALGVSYPPADARPLLAAYGLCCHEAGR